MTTAQWQVVETSVTVNNNSPIQDYVHPDDQTQPTFEMTPGFKPFTIKYFEDTISTSLQQTGPRFMWSSEPHKGQATHLQSKQEQIVKKCFFKKINLFQNFNLKQ